MALFNNRYRVETTRLANWDYGANAPYFITICTKKRSHHFGKIEHDEMILNDTGTVVLAEWLKTPNLRPDMNITLDEFVVMPNHFHAIICIGENKFNGNATIAKFGPQTNNLASIVRGFKSAVTRNTAIIDPNFGWQARFHDSIVKDEAAYLHIRNYIINNPANWQNDKFYLP